MSQFAWFDLRTKDAKSAEGFYTALLGWGVVNEGDMPPMFAGPDGPWALIGGAPLPGGSQWLPYIRVDELDKATEKAKQLGAKVIQEKAQGPAGTFTAIADPTGAPVVLWQPATA